MDIPRSHIPPNNARKSIGWQYGLCPLDAKPGDFGPFEPLVRMWQQKFSSNGALPVRGDFDFLDFKDWWGRIAIARFQEDPFDVQFGLWGTELTEWWGVDYTNKFLGEQSTSPEFWKMVEGKYFEEMVADPFIGLVSGLLTQHERSHIKVIGVDLPLAAQDGSVSQVITAHIRVDPDDPVEAIVPNAPINRYF